MDISPKKRATKPENREPVKVSYSSRKKSKIHELADAKKQQAKEATFGDVTEKRWRQEYPFVCH
jgi:hypothetical protein